MKDVVRCPVSWYCKTLDKRVVVSKDAIYFEGFICDCGSWITKADGFHSDVVYGNREEFDEKGIEALRSKIFLRSSTFRKRDLRSAFIMRCDKCLRSNVKGRYILGVAVCYDCYPQYEGEKDGKRDISECSISFDMKLEICKDCPDYSECRANHKKGNNSNVQSLFYE